MYIYRDSYTHTRGSNVCQKLVQYWSFNKLRHGLYMSVSGETATRSNTLQHTAIQCKTQQQ